MSPVPTNRTNRTSHQKSHSRPTARLSRRQQQEEFFAFIRSFEIEIVGIVEILHEREVGAKPRHIPRVEKLGTSCAQPVTVTRLSDASSLVLPVVFHGYPPDARDYWTEKCPAPRTSNTILNTTKSLGQGGLSRPHPACR